LGFTIIKIALGIFFGIIELFKELINFIKDGIFSIIEFIINFIILSVNVISSILSFLMKNIIKIFKAIITALSKVWDFIKNIGAKIWEYIKSFALKLLNNIEGLVNIMKNFIVKLIKMIKNCLYKIFHLILDNFLLSFCLFFAVSALAIGAMILYLREHPDGLDLTCDCSCHSIGWKLFIFLDPLNWARAAFGVTRSCQYKVMFDRSKFKPYGNCVYCGK